MTGMIVAMDVDMTRAHTMATPTTSPKMQINVHGGRHGQGHAPAQQSDEKPDQDLAREHPLDVRQLDATGGQPADDHSRGLQPDIAPHRRDDRDKRHQGHDFLDRVPEEPQDRARHHAPDEVGQEPGDAEPDRLEHRGVHDLLLLLDLGPGHLHHVLGGCVMDDVHYVVHGDDPDEPVLLVHDRDRQQVVARDQFGDLFLIGVGGDADDLPLDHGPETGVRGYLKQLAQREDAHKLLATIGDID